MSSELNVGGNRDPRSSQSCGAPPQRPTPRGKRCEIFLSPCLPVSLSTHLVRRLVSVSPCLLVLLLTGCSSSRGAPSGQALPKPEVVVSEALAAEVIDYEEFPGRLEAVNMVEIRARVTGYLNKVNFQEGADVKKDALLFEIDPRPYEIGLARAEGTVTQMEGRIKRLDADLVRAQNLLAARGISQEEFDKIAGDRTEAKGLLDNSKADRDQAKLNMTWTKVRAPLSGRISRRFVDPGNLIKADETVLTTIVDLDPIYAYFDIDERTTLKLQRLVKEGKIKWSLDTGLTVQVGLADDVGFPWQGIINFADNRVDPDTGTWRLRAVIQNPERTLSPGLFVRMRAPLGEKYHAVLVSEKALGTDQGQKFVYVVDSANTVTYRRVHLGKVHRGLIAITDGLTEGEKVIVSGLQRARPGIEVQATVAPMPVAGENGKNGKNSNDKKG
jgi:membrane fusion protein, multidrug efflux system